MNWGFLFRYIRDDKGSPEFLQQLMNDSPLEQSTLGDGGGDDSINVLLPLADI